MEINSITIMELPPHPDVSLPELLRVPSVVQLLPVMVAAGRVEKVPVLVSRNYMFEIGAQIAPTIYGNIVRAVELRRQGQVCVRTGTFAAIKICSLARINAEQARRIENPLTEFAALQALGAHEETQGMALLIEASSDQNNLYAALK
jgi:hypothetical protein